MAQTIMDGQKLEVGGVGKLGALLDQAQEHIPEGRIVTKLYLDDEEVLDLNHEQLLERTLDKVGEVRVQTGSIREELIHNVNELLVFLKEVRPILRQASRELRYGSVAEAAKKLADCFEGMETMVASIDQVSRLLPALDAGLTEEELKYFSTREGELLKSVVVDFEKQEWLALADRIEFQMEPLMGRWYSVLNRVTGTLKSQQNEDA